MSNPSDENVLDWEDLSTEDQLRAEQLLKELNSIFDRNLKQKEEKPCKDSTSTEQ